MTTALKLFEIREICKCAKWKTKAASPFHSAPHGEVIISELHWQLSTPFTYLSPVQAEKKKAAQGDDSHGNPEIERLRKEVQDTKQINKKLRELLQVWRFTFAVEVKHLDVCPCDGESAESAVFQGDVLCADVLQEPQNQSESAERHSHTVALLERQAKEDVLSERNRLQTLLQLELGNTHT